MLIILSWTSCPTLVDLRSSVRVTTLFTPMESLKAKKNLKRWYGQKERKNYDIVLLLWAVIVMSHLTNNPTKSCPEINPTTKEKNTRSPGHREKERRKLDCHFKWPAVSIVDFDFFLFVSLVSIQETNLRLEIQIVFFIFTSHQNIFSN